jgi:hypothetical protein
MKTVVSVMLLLCLLSVTPLLVHAAERATTYKNCTELNKVYKGGVAKVGAKNIGGKTNYKPFYNNELYKANSGSDRDKDGIACER